MISMSIYEDLLKTILNAKYILLKSSYSGPTGWKPHYQIVLKLVKIFKKNSLMHVKLLGGRMKEWSLYLSMWFY